MRIAVVTANYGGFDTIKEIPEQTVKHDRYYFSEKNSHYPMDGLDNRLKAKYYKMLAHKVLPHDIIIWVDGNVQVKSPRLIESMVEALDNHDIAISRHPFRDDIYQEAQFICHGVDGSDNYLKARYKSSSIRAEVMRYGQGLKGLYWCGLFARRNTHKVNKAFEQWHWENILMSNFDQLNFVKCMDGLDINTFNFGPFYKNEYYQLINHNKIA